MRRWTSGKARLAADFTGWEQDAKVENVIGALRADVSCRLADLAAQPWFLVTRRQRMTMPMLMC